MNLVKRSLMRKTRSLSHNITLADGRRVVIEEAGNQNSKQTLVFLPGALGSLQTDFQPQFHPGRYQYHE